MTSANRASISQGDSTSDNRERLLSGEGGIILDLQFGEHDDVLAVTRLGLFRSADGGEQWIRIETPPLIQTLHRSNGWWLGTEIGLFRADLLDGPWHPMISGLSVTVVSSDDHRDLILAVTTNEGLLRSEDGGHTWEDANPGLPGDDIVAMHRSPAIEQDGTIFVATESGLFRSRNGGRAWRQISLPADDIQCFTIDDHQLLIGTTSDGYWMSPDAGRTWRQSLPGTEIIEFGASRDGHIVVVTDVGLFALDSNGSSLSHSPIPPDALCAIETGDRMLVGTLGHGVVNMLPGGTWNDSSTGLEATTRDRVLAIGQATIVTSSRSGGILHSADGGASWRELIDAPLDVVLDFDARVTPANGLEVIACDGHRASIYRENWQVLDTAFPLAVAWLDREPALITADGRFVCGSVQVKMLPGSPRITGARLIPVLGHPSLLWSILHVEGVGVVVLRSPNGGRQWEPLLHVDASSAVSLAVDIEASGREDAYVAVGNRIFRVLESPEPVWTGDDGMTISAIAMDPDGRILLATNHGLIVVSRDFARTERVAGSPTLLLDVDVEMPGGAIVIERGGSIWGCGLGSVRLKPS